VRQTMDNREIEELLEALWTAEEAGEVNFEGVRRRCHVPVGEEMFRELETLGYVEQRDGRLRLTENGRSRAEGVIRRHRLAERLLTDVLNFSVDRAEATACEYEHALVPEVTESICTLLGHPRTCPHGTAIPEGPCCREARSVIRQTAIPLARVGVGSRGRVAYLRSGSHERLRRIMALGISPGTCLELEQASPAFVLHVGAEGTEIALERSVAEDIFVWTTGPGICPPEEAPERGHRRRRFGWGRRHRREA
jgi:DtxR family Mn-dependent transcriptional regulator